MAFLQVFLFFSFFYWNNPPPPLPPPPPEPLFLSFKTVQIFLPTFPACRKYFSHICRISIGNQITTKEVTFSEKVFLMEPLQEKLVDYID